jgi:adenylate kinase family enzyme
MKTLYLLRGLPGSGKSTLAEQLGGTHFETDKYFYDDNGKYNFDGSKLKDAHQWCQDSVSNAMVLNHTAGHNETIVVSNTFTQEWEMKPYMDMAKDWGYMVFSVVVENRHGGVNQHGVPNEKLQQMQDRFEIKLK